MEMTVEVNELAWCGNGEEGRRARQSSSSSSSSSRRQWRQ